MSESREIKGRQQTNYTLTPEGREAFRKYLEVLDAIVTAARRYIRAGGRVKADLHRAASLLL